MIIELSISKFKLANLLIQMTNENRPRISLANDEIDADRLIDS